MSEITREELQHEIDVRVEERSEYEGSRQCRRTEELDEQLALYKLALIGLDAQERQPLLGQCTFDGCQYDQIAALREQLRTARSDALEEAAKVCEAQVGYAIDLEEWNRMTKKEHGVYACHQCAAFIRAMPGAGK